MMHFRKELKTLIREYEKKGWEIIPTKGNKIRWIPPFASSEIVITADHAIDAHAIENTRKRLEKLIKGNIIDG